MDIKVSELANLPTKLGVFKVQSFKEGEKEHLCIMSKDLGDVVNVRIHSECLTGDALLSLKCDCGAQLEYTRTRRLGNLLKARGQGHRIVK